MKLHELSKPIGSTKNTKRKGRGTATGQGKTGGRGMNGQKSRSGYTEESRREGSRTSSEKNGLS